LYWREETTERVKGGKNNMTLLKVIRVRRNLLIKRRRSSYAKKEALGSKQSAGKQVIKRSKRGAGKERGRT